MLGTVYSNYNTSNRDINSTSTAIKATSTAGVAHVLPEPIDSNTAGGGVEGRVGGGALFQGSVLEGSGARRHHHLVPPPYPPSPLREGGYDDGCDNPTTTAAVTTSTTSPPTLITQQLHHLSSLATRSMDSGTSCKVAAGLLESTDGEDFEQNQRGCYISNSNFNNPISSSYTATPLSTIIGSHSSQLFSIASPLVPADSSTSSLLTGVINTAAGAATPFAFGGAGGVREATVGPIPPTIGNSSLCKAAPPYTPMDAPTTTTSTLSLSRRPYATPISMRVGVDEGKGAKAPPPSYPPLPLPSFPPSHSNNHHPAPPSTISSPKASQKQIRTLFAAAGVVAVPSTSSSTNVAKGLPIPIGSDGESSCRTLNSPLAASTKICSITSSVDHHPPLPCLRRSSSSSQQFPLHPSAPLSGNFSSSNSIPITPTAYAARRFHYDPAAAVSVPQALTEHPNLLHHHLMMRGSSPSNALNASADLMFSSDLLAASYLDSDGPALVPMSTTIGPRSLEPSDDEAAEDELLIKYRSYVGGVDSRPDWLCLKTFAYGHVVAFATDADGCPALLAVLKEALAPIWAFINSSIITSRGRNADSFSSSSSPPSRSASQRDALQIQVELRSLAAITPQLEAGPRRELVVTQLQAVIQQLAPNLFQHSLSAFSSRVVQFFVDTHFAPFLIPIAQGLRGHCFMMAKSGIGSRILRSLLEFCGDRITDADDEDGEDDEDDTVLNAAESVVSTVVNLFREIDSVDSHTGDSYAHMSVLDSNASQVLQCALKNIPDEIGVFMARRLAERFMEVAVHPYGSRVIQSLFEEVRHPRVSPATEQAALRLMVQAFRNIKTLIHTQFGNSVLSVAISNAPSSPEDAEFVQSGIEGAGLDFTSIPSVVCSTFDAGYMPIDRLVVAEFGVNATMTDLLIHARNRYGSHVLQRALERAPIDTLCSLTEKLLFPTQMSLSQIASGVDTASTGKKSAATLQDALGGLTSQDVNIIPEFGALLFDKFGNYVVQLLFTRLPADLQSTVLNALEPFFQKLLNSYNGKAFVKKFAPELSAAYCTELTANIVGGERPLSVRVGDFTGVGSIGGGAIEKSLHSSPRGGRAGGSSSPSPAGSFVENRRGQVFNEFIENSRYDPKVPVQFDDIPPPPVYGADYNSDDGWDLQKRRSSVNTTSACNTSCGLGATGHFSRSDSNVNTSHNNNTTHAAAEELRFAVLKQRHQNELLIQQINFQQILIQQQQQFLMNASGFMGPTEVNYLAWMMMNLQQQQLQAFMSGGGMHFNNNMGNGHVFGAMNALPQPHANQQQPHIPHVGTNYGNGHTAQHHQHQQQHHPQQGDGTVSESRRFSTESLTVFSSWVNQEPSKGASTPDADATATLPTTIGDSLTCNPRSGLNFKLPPSTHPTGLYFNRLAAQGVDSDGGSTPATFQSIVPVGEGNLEHSVDGDIDEGGNEVAHALSHVAWQSQDDREVCAPRYPCRARRQRKRVSEDNDNVATISSDMAASSQLLHYNSNNGHPANLDHHRLREEDQCTLSRKQDDLRQHDTSIIPNRHEKVEEEHSDVDIASSVDFEFSWRSGSGNSSQCSSSMS